MRTELNVSWVVMRIIFTPSPKSAPVAVFPTEPEARHWVGEKTQIKGKNEYTINKVVTEVNAKSFLQRLGVAR